MSGRLRVVAHLSAKPDRIEALKTVLFGLIEPTRREAGCIQYELHVNDADPTELTFIEEWTDDAALDAHLASDHFRSAAASVAELVTAAPDIRRYTPIG